MKNTVDQIATDFNITKKLAKEVVDATLLSLAQEIVETGELKITGFGSFKVMGKPARNGRNPKTGEALKIAAHKTLKFKISKNLKQAIQ